MGAERSPTLEDVARVAGVSRATVSRVVNGIRNVDQDIQDAVRTAIEKIGYAPNHAARSLVTRRTGSIALVVSGAGGHVFGDPFFGRVVGGVVEYLRERDMHPLLMLADTDVSRENVLSHLRQGGADGALLVSTSADDPLPVMCTMAKVPAVLFARPATSQQISYVDVAHREGARLATRHLLDRGCKRLATITGPPNLPASQERLAGFRDELLAPAPDVAGNFTVDSGEAAMRWLLDAHPEVDGIFAANDLMALGALNVLHAAGRRVPKDVAVVGFDDSSAALAGRPQLTTVRQPVEEMGAKMAELLLAHIQNPRRKPSATIFDPVLVPRDSA